MPAHVGVLEVEGAVHLHIGNGRVVCKRMELHSAERAEDLAARRCLVDVKRPALLDGEGDASRQADESEAQFLDAVLALLLPVLVHRDGLMRGPRHGLYRRIAQQVENLRDVIDAHVEHGASGGDAFLHEGARAVAIDIGPPAAAVSDGLREVEVSEVPPVDEPLRRLRLGGEHRRQLDAQHLAGPLCRLHHRLPVRIGARYRLLAVDVLAGLQRRDGDRCVQVVVETHVDRVDLFHRQELAEVREHLRDAVLVGDALRLGLVDIRRRDQLHRELPVPVEMVLSDLADSDYSDLDLLRHIAPHSAEVSRRSWFRTALCRDAAPSPGPGPCRRTRWRRIRHTRPPAGAGTTPASSPARRAAPSNGCGSRSDAAGPSRRMA